MVHTGIDDHLMLRGTIPADPQPSSGKINASVSLSGAEAWQKVET
jgi:hypothetical protein